MTVDRSATRAVKYVVIIVMCVGALLALTSVEVIRISADSMAPTLQDGDYVLIVFRPERLSNIIGIEPLVRRNDIVVFYPPTRGSSDPERLLIKRVVGMPSDRLRLEHGVLLRGGQAVAEHYVTYHNPKDRFADDWPRTGTEGAIVGQGEVFVLGDNRKQSLDSRAFGPVPMSSIIGVVITRIPRLGSSRPAGAFK
jgi:signal peptidase I